MPVAKLNNGKGFVIKWLTIKKGRPRVNVHNKTVLAVDG